MYKRLIFATCLFLSLNFLLAGVEKSSFYGNWFTIDEFDNVYFYSIKPWGKVTLKKDGNEGFDVQMGTWLQHSNGIIIQFSNRKNEYLYPSIKSLNILISEDQMGKQQRSWVLVEKPFSVSSMQEIDYLSLYREKTQDLVLKEPTKYQESSSFEDDQVAVLPFKTYSKDQFVNQEKRVQGLLKKLNDSSNFKGIWKSVEEKGAEFGVDLKTDGTFSFLKEPDQIRGEWMVVNQGALLIYPSGWRQSINRSTSNLKKYYLSSFRPNDELSDSPALTFEVKFFGSSKSKPVENSKKAVNIAQSYDEALIQKADYEKQTEDTGALGINARSDENSAVLPEFIGSWQNLEKNDPAFGVNLFNNGRFSLLENPTKIVGEWMVINQRALLIYRSGWRQLIDWSIGNPKKYYLSSHRPGQRMNDPSIKKFAIQKR